MSPPPPAHKGVGGQIRRKRKLVSSGGQKWFKGTPRKTRPPAPVQGQVMGLESPPPLPPMLVQFTFDGEPELRLSVYEQIAVTFRTDSESDGGKKKKGKLPKEEEKKGEEERPLPMPLFHEIEGYELEDAAPAPNAYIRWMEDVELGEEVEYHVDEEDSAWLDLVNGGKGGKESGAVGLEVMELLMDRLEKESYLQMQSSGLDQRPVIDDDAVCCICMDGECQNSNAILFCDMCNLAVHQECYGVPYIPEGQWLCRRCLQSPSREVECVLCPNKGGAFKQTDDGRWAHVVCAIWIPEVCFANTVFLEPVDSVNNIPPARWRLCCFICKYKGKGACIQCHKSNCYIAFHVTCAQHAGLCMRMDTVRVGSTVTVRKTAYCDNHAPPDFIRQNREENSPTVRQKLKACRKMLAEKRSAKPTVSIPTIPPDRLTEIASSVSFARKNQFIKRLLSYWKLKRIQRNGVPLLRRLQAASNHPPNAVQHTPTTQSSRDDSAGKYLIRLRQELERARLLCELMRKRERLKRDIITIKIQEWEYKATPFVKLLYSVLDALGKLDPHNIFAEPVDPEAVPDYHSVIHNPMDLSTMRQKATELYYDSLDEMKADFQLMVDNCLLYNSKETIFHRAAVRLQETGRMIFKEAERMEAVIGYDPVSRLHLDHAPEICNTPSMDAKNEKVTDEVDAFFKDDDRHELAPSDLLTKLQDLLDKVCGLPNNKAKHRRYQRLMREIGRIRHANSNSNSPRPSPKREVNNSITKQRNASPPPRPPSPRALRRKSIAENTNNNENSNEPAWERPPKRRATQIQPKTPNRRPSRSTETSPSRSTSAVTTPTVTNKTTPGRRQTRLSNDEDRPTKPMANGLMRNGRNTKASPVNPNYARRRVLQSASSSIPATDSFSVYRDTTEHHSSDGEEAEEDEDDELNDDDDDDDDEESSSGDEESDAEAYSSDSAPSQPSPRVTRGEAASRKTRTASDDSSSDEEEEEEEEESEADSTDPGQVVWAFSKGAWSPAVVVDPDAQPPDKNGVSIPLPPSHVMSQRRKKKDSFLVLFFSFNNNASNAWDWVGSDQLELLGVDAELDRRHLDENKKRKGVRRAYEIACRQRQDSDRKSCQELEK